jgi:hypothetical protein
MGWLVLSYSMPSASRSGPRVAVWRRLRRIGAISPRGGVYVLPAREECLEAFQWLAQEVEQAKGETLLMHVERFDGLDDAHLAALFRQARKAEYDALDAEAAALERVARSKGRPREHLTRPRERLARLRRSHAEIARVDFFDTPERARVAARLTRIEQALAPEPAAAVTIAPLRVAEYRGRRWVTRPNPHVDRLACAWLVRRFIDADALIRYADDPEADEIAFDMRVGPFRHHGNLCTFEGMVKAFGFDDPGLRLIAAIVHELDLQDGRFARPEAAGIEAILRGWAGLGDTERESRGRALFDGLYASAQSSAPAGTRRADA